MLKPFDVANWRLEWPIALYLLGDIERYSNGRHNAETTTALVATGAMQAWFALVDGEAKACATTQILNYPTGLKVVSFALLGGGDFDTWIDLVDAGAFDEFAKQAGASRIEAITRPGVGKALKRRGWREFQHFYERDVR